MKVLGGRSPYEVVLGLKPKLPASLDPSVPVEHVTIDEYVAKVAQYCRETYDMVSRIQREAAEASQEETHGS